jgi:hypothetical protein
MAALLVGTGCAANSYTIPTSELQRLSALPPEVRSQSVLVSQEISGTDTEAADPVNGDTTIIIVPQVNVYSGGVRGSGGGPRVHGGRGGGLAGLKPTGGGSDGKAAAIAVIALAVTAVVVVAAIEGSRFDGHVRLHPMHPVHLFGKDGSQAIMPLAWIDPQAAAWTEKAVVKPYEGPWQQLDRSPLTRGGTYGVYGGYGTSTSVYGDTNFGPSFAIQGGYFPIQEVGILATIEFAWRNNRDNGTLFDSRYMLEVQALPLKLGPLHAGGYAGLGPAYRWEDTERGTATDKGMAYIAGAMLQLELHTRIALTGRLGYVNAHGERATDMLFGLSVY